VKYIYLLRAGKSHYKVGLAKSVNSRVDSIRTSNPEHIEVVAVRLVEFAESTEKSIHEYLSNLRTSGGTEWFKLTPEQVIEVAILMNKQPEISGLVDSFTLKESINRQMKEFSSISKSLEHIVKFIAKNIEDKYLTREQLEKQRENNESIIKDIKNSRNASSKDEEEILVNKAIKAILQEDRASTSLLQRKLSIGYGRASRVMDILESRGIIGAYNGAKARNINIKSPDS
jgi:S-DNA-T family DNA segregation ATPase FtsK/SpoIIIE